jgi:outer membrane protein TolC
VATRGLSLEDALHAVKQNDFRLKQFEEEALAFRAESEASTYLPDPTVFVGMQNLPTDTFAFDQEPMTNLRVGVRQMFPKGDLLDIQSSMSGVQSELQLGQSKLRWLAQKKQAEQAWLEAWYWQKKLELLDEDQVFIQQVHDFIRSLYEVGAKDQSDLIGAQLEMVKLSESRIEATRKHQLFRQQLNTLANQVLAGDKLTDALPLLSGVDLTVLDASQIDMYLLRHPQLVLLDQQITLAQKKADLVEQDFEPAWGLELSYGLRDGENANGSSRPDFFSAGVNFQMPLFSDGKQSQNHVAAKQRTSVATLQRDEALSQMRFEAESLLQQYRSTIEQRSLYEGEIIPALEKQRKSALQSYESDRGDFRLVMTLLLKEQGAKAMRQRLRVDEQKLISSLNYLLGISSTNTETGVPTHHEN